MALDDPNITKILFYKFNDPVTVTVDYGKLARLACVLIRESRRPHVEIIDCAPGVYRVRALKKDIPTRKIFFQVDLLESFLPKKIKSGRYQ